MPTTIASFFRLQIVRVVERQRGGFLISYFLTR